MADMGVKRIVPLVKPRIRAVLPQHDVSIMSPWYDKQRHLMLRDNLTEKERDKWHKQTKTLYWNPSRAACINGNRNERLLSIDNRLKEKMQKKLVGYQQTDVVTVDTASLAKFTQTEEAKLKLSKTKLRYMRKYQQMKANFNQLPSVDGIELAEETVLQSNEEVDVQQFNTNNEEDPLMPSSFFLTEQYDQEEQVWTPKSVVVQDEPSSPKQISKNFQVQRRLIQTRVQARRSCIVDDFTSANQVRNPLSQGPKSRRSTKRLLVSEDTIDSSAGQIPFLTFDDCTNEPPFNHHANEQKRRKMQSLTQVACSASQDNHNGQLTRKIQDVLKFQQRHMLNVNQSLQAERQRGFRINMDNLPQPDQRWCHKRALRRRGPLSIERNVFSRDNVQQSDRMGLDPATRDAYAYMSYENNARTTVNSQHGSAENPLNQTGRYSFPQQQKNKTDTNIVDKKNTTMNLGTSDPRSALSFLSEAMLGSELNLAKTGKTGYVTASGQKPIETSQSGYRKIKNNMKNLLKKSSMALGRNMQLVHGENANYCCE